MKYLLGMLCLLAAGFCAAEVTVEIQPDPPVAGEPFQFVLTSSEGRPAVAELPEIAGLRWFRNNTSSGYRNINGRSSYTVGITALAEKPGVYEIPALTVRVGRKVRQTRPVTIKVAANEAEAAAPSAEGGAAPAIFGRMRFGGERKKFYLGEEVPLMLDIYVRPGTQVTGLAYPDLVIPHAVYHDYRRANPENSRFAKPTERVRTVSGVQYMVVTLRTAFRSLAAGSVTPEASTVVGLARRERRTRARDPFWDDDFFAGAFGRRESVQRKLVFESPGAVEFLPLPPAPADAAFTGLVGNWKMTFEFDSAACKVGEIMTLRLRLEGEGAADLLSLPKLELPGFRVYPPEIRKDPGEILVSWQIIPLKPGKNTLALSLATFDPESGQYRVKAFSRELAATPSDRPADNVVVDAPAPKKPADRPAASDAGNGDPAPKPAHTHLLYLRKAPGDAVYFPLERGRLPWLLGLLIGGPLVWAGAELAVRRRERLSGSETLRRRRKAQTASRAALRDLKNAPDDEAWDRVLHTEVLPLLADRFDLPPGSTAAEVAEKVFDRALADALAAAGRDAYLPGGAKHAPVDRPAVLKALKKLFVLALLPFAAWTLAADDFAEAGRAYDRGDFAQAEKLYAQELAALAPAEAEGVLYNLGCAAFMNGHPAAALAYFDAAVRLAPRDSAALENLNVARTRLGLPAEGRVESPRDLAVFCRDVFRPDGWLLVAAAAWFAGFLFLACRRLLPGTVLHTALAAAGLAILVALGAYFSQIRGPYARDRAVIGDGGAEMRALPTGTGKAEGGLSAGHEVRILEERADYCLVRCGSLQGWVPRRDVVRIFPVGR